MLDIAVEPTKLFRQALGTFATGVTVVTAIDEQGSPRGFTANSFTSVSLNPPLILVCIASGSAGHAVFTNSDTFCVNVLAEDQRTTAPRMIQGKSILSQQFNSAHVIPYHRRILKTENDADLPGVF